MKTNKLILLTSFATVVLQGQVGINNNTPDPSSAMDIVSNPAKPGGFLPPRINLQSQNDGATIANPAYGLTVYNTNSSATGLREGLTLNTGTPSVPLWKSLMPDNGVRIEKMVYFGPTVDPTKTVVIGGFEFRYTTPDGNNHLEARLVQQPTGTVTLTGNRLGWVGSIGMTVVSKSWGPNNNDWAIWREVDFMADGASHFFYLTPSNSDQLYKVSSFVRRNSFTSLVIEVY